MAKVEIPRTVVQMREELGKAKTLIQRMNKGQHIINVNIQNGSILKAQEAMTLYARLAFDLNNHLENALFMHEAITTGRTTVVNRYGRAVNSINYPVDQTIEVDLFLLESIKLIRDVFGNELEGFLEVTH